MDSCPFCKIIQRHLPAYILTEDETVLSFLSLENHPLIVPKTHIPTIYSLSRATGHRVMDEIVTVAKAVKDGLGCDGVSVTQANGPAAGQDVFHVHLHIYPRWHDPSLDERRMAKEELQRKITGAVGPSPRA